MVTNDARLAVLAAIDGKVLACDCLAYVEFASETGDTNSPSRG